MEVSETDNQTQEEPKQSSAIESEDMKKNLEKAKKETIPGVIYISRIPTKMNVKIIREYFSQFGKVDRIYLEPKEKKRKNEPRSFTEGWVEFKKKKIAKNVANELNNTQIGGKRKNPWFNELWNIKYLKNFRWTHLNERLAYEQEVRKQRLRQEIQLAKKEANFYIQNVEKNEKRKRFEKKLSKTSPDESNANKSDEQENKQVKRVEHDEENTNMKKKHPIFERKIKITGNDTFLKQIFS